MLSLETEGGPMSAWWDAHGIAVLVLVAVLGVILACVLEGRRER